ncbi:MAG: hypothetical protein ACXVHM_02255 [Methanobacterium sp.]
MGEIREIKSVPVMPFALITGAILAVLTFIWTIIIAIFGISSLAFLPVQNMSNILGAGLLGAVILIVVGTIVMFIVGFIVYAVIAIIYNVLAPRIGGIKLELA